MPYLNYVMFGTLGFAGVVFVVVALSLLYHWGYFGISRTMRSILFTFFVAGGITLLLSAMMIMNQSNIINI